MAAMPVHGPVLGHHHHGMRVHHPAIVERICSEHQVPTSAATPATSTTFSMVDQFNAEFGATVAIADNDIWEVGDSTASGTEQPFAAHFNGTNWSAVPTPTLSHGGVFSDVSAAASNIEDATCREAGPGTRRGRTRFCAR
jgi:hypothetical protein